jgi:hypothetical protein
MPWNGLFLKRKQHGNFFEDWTQMQFISPLEVSLRKYFWIFAKYLALPYSLTMLYIFALLLLKYGNFGLRIMKINVRVFRIPKKLTVRRVWICIIFSFLLLIVDWGDFTLNPKFSRDEIRTVSDYLITIRQ